MNAILECDRVTKAYGGLMAVKDVSFSIQEGEVFAIVGPNGAGKTTLFDVISGLSPATAGTVTFEGREIQRSGPDRICRMGLSRSFQTPVAFDTQTVLTNVLVGSVYGSSHVHRLSLRFRADAQEAALDALDICQLLNKQHAIAGDLSVFERKRLMLATALATKCRALMLDEPVGGLTAGEREELTVLLRDLSGSGMTILMIEHVMKTVHALAHRMMVLHHGEKILEGSPAQVLQDERVLEVYLGGKAQQPGAESSSGLPGGLGA